MRTHSGPIPDPDTLERYNQIIPNAANRILEMAEKEQAHRHKEHTGDRSLKGWGLACGMLVAASLVGMCLYSMYLGHFEIVRGVLMWGGGIIAVLVGVGATKRLIGWSRKSN